ncbi:MAG: TIR domain-containing protein [Lachnospiraceae bacterium]|nr:TIR domain-containing protein [Lachnospiraceae bacterium]
MSIFKCKMCGGTLEIKQNESVAVCEYCGTKQTIPKLDDNKRENLYDRANHFRRNNEYDKAMGIYEQILNEDHSDAEAYWSLVLCRYGIEYVEEPSTHKRVPTINRAQFTSIFDDADYKSALQYADSNQRIVYEEEAKTINEIQKGILAISQEEDPFDVFICYKETDANGRRTQDSVLANDLYHELTEEGFKVFFSRITLEDKLGIAYEPYIFAALNSAKVMVVIGTRAEYFNAVWVKNEWSRYLALIKGGAKKTLVPAYRDMDPYDLPEEFSHLQAQDMSKLGFMQDLIRGIQKLVEVDASQAVSKEPAVVNNGNVNTAPLLKRAFMFLEDGKWEEAYTYCEKVLDQEPENARAYLGELMAELKVHTEDTLENCKEPFDHLDSYRKVIRFGDTQLQEKLSGAIEHIKERNENLRLEGIYTDAVNAMRTANTQEKYRSLASRLHSILEYKDAAQQEQRCIERAEECRKDEIYADAEKIMRADTVLAYTEAMNKFQFISGWRDAAEQILRCQQGIEDIKRKEEETRIAEKKRIRQNSIIFIAICLIVGIILLLFKVIIPNMRYNRALNAIEEKDYVYAYDVFEKLGDYKDSAEKRDECKALAEQEMLVQEALAEQEMLVQEALAEQQMFVQAEVGDSVIFGAYEQDNVISNGEEGLEWTVLAREDNKILVISKYCLDCRPYHWTKGDVTWENCSLREWLNNIFYNLAFSDDEQEKIIETRVSDPDNEGLGTIEKVFVLSREEADEYLEADEVVRGTEYVVEKNVKTNNDGKILWWLRSPSQHRNGNYYEFSDGSVWYEGKYYTTIAVRPALWIDISSYLE